MILLINRQLKSISSSTYESFKLGSIIAYELEPFWEFIIRLWIKEIKAKIIKLALNHPFQLGMFRWKLGFYQYRV